MTTQQVKRGAFESRSDSQLRESGLDTERAVHDREDGAPPRLTSLCHHRLEVWHLARELVRLVNRWPIGDAELRDQAERAARSVACNIAEGSALDGAAKKRHFRQARASTVEVVGAYEVAEDIGEKVPVAEVQALGARIAAMLFGLVRHRR